MAEQKEVAGTNSVPRSGSISPVVPLESETLLDAVRSIHKRAGIPFPLWPESRLLPDRSAVIDKLLRDLRERS